MSGTDEIRDLGSGFTAIIGAYRTQFTGNSAGLEVREPAQRIQIVRDHGTRRQLAWAEGLVHASTVWDPQAINKMRQPGAYRYVRPTAERIDREVSSLLMRARDAWHQAQNRIYVIAMDGMPTGMVRAPHVRWAVEDAEAAGLLRNPEPPVNGEEHYTQILSLRKAWLEFDNPDRPQPGDLRDLLIRLVERHPRRSDTDLSAIRFRKRVQAIQTYEELYEAAMAALSWMQGLSSELPAGVETNDDYRRAIWPASSQYHPDNPAYVGRNP